METIRLISRAAWIIMRPVIEIAAAVIGSVAFWIIMEFLTEFIR